MFDSINFLIENGVPVWGETTVNFQKHPPPFLVHKCKVEGRYLSNQLIKHSEVQDKYFPSEENEEDSDDDEDLGFVFYHQLQKSER